MFAILSVLFGIIPEAIFFTYFFVKAKDITDTKRRWMLFIAILLIHIASSAILSFSVWFHIVFIFGMWLAAHFICGSEIIDVFLFVFFGLIVTLLGFICYYAIPNYWIALAINRVMMLFMVFYPKSIWRNLYKTYRDLWNRRDDGRIKSITLRNISLITFNIMLCILTIVAIQTYAQY